VAVWAEAAPLGRDATAERQRARAAGLGGRASEVEWRGGVPPGSGQTSALIHDLMTLRRSVFLINSRPTPVTDPIL
jgi:hypothetical protein